MMKRRELADDPKCFHAVSNSAYPIHFEGVVPGPVARWGVDVGCGGSFRHRRRDAGEEIQLAFEGGAVDGPHRGQVDAGHGLFGFGAQRCDSNLAGGIGFHAGSLDFGDERVRVPDRGDGRFATQPLGQAEHVLSDHDGGGYDRGQSVWSSGVFAGRGGLFLGHGVFHGVQWGPLHMAGNLLSSEALTPRAGGSRLEESESL